MTDKVSTQLKDFAEKQSESFVLTTSNGAPVTSLTASLTAGPRGPILLQDFTFIDHYASFDRERIPERVVHAKGAGSFGYFEVTKPEFSKYCCAKIFQSVGKKTPVAARFSTVGGESGSADTVRDPRGFAVKFYSEDGIWDFVGNNTPIFFIRDAMLFPSFIHTQKRNPATHCKDPNMMWDFFSLRPETTHQVSILFSDRGIPDGFRHMNGYGSHTYKVVNSFGEAHYVKWHFKTDQGIKNLSVKDAERLAGSDPDYSIRDLYNAIANGCCPSWTLYVQLMTVAQAETISFNPFDLTKIWPHADFPLMEVGRLVLNRNPKNYFAEVEQIAFSPSHFVPGIEASPDKMLQGRLFSYPDTQRHRLGANYQSLPINCPFACRVANCRRDGPMMPSSNQLDAPNYFPNSFHGPTINSAVVRHREELSSVQVDRFESGEDDNFTQAGDFYRRVLTWEEKERLTDNIASSLADTETFIQQRAIENFRKADVEYGDRIQEKISCILSSKSQTGCSMEHVAAELNPPRVVPRSRL